MKTFLSGSDHIIAKSFLSVKYYEKKLTIRKNILNACCIGLLKISPTFSPDESTSILKSRTDIQLNKNPFPSKKKSLDTDDLHIILFGDF